MSTVQLLYAERPGVVEATMCLPEHLHSIGEKTMQTKTTPSYLLTRREAAVYLNVSQRTLDQLVADGLPRVKIGSCVRLERADLDAFIAAQKAA